MPLVINNLGGEDTHTRILMICTGSILRNQVRASHNTISITHLHEVTVLYIVTSCYLSLIDIANDVI